MQLSEAAMTRAPLSSESAAPAPAARRQLAQARLWGLPAGLWFAAPALAIIALFFLLPIVGVAGAQPDRLRHLRAGRLAEPALRGLRQLRRSLLQTRAILDGARQHALLRRHRRAAVGRRRRWARRCCWSRS